jgi:hypothetical protein
LVAGFLLLSIDPAFTQSSPARTPWKPRVSLYVTVEADADVKDVIKSGLLKRLRQFSEVEIEDDIEQANNAIFIEVIEFGGDPAPRVYAISVVYTERLWFSLAISYELSGLARSEGEKEEAEALTKEIVKTKNFIGQSLHSCAEPRLGQTLNEIVASIDSDLIEPERQLYQRTFKKHIREEERPKTEASPNEK